MNNLQFDFFFLFSFDLVNGGWMTLKAEQNRVSE